MSHNTHKTIADSFQPTPDSGDHLCHLYMTSKIPRTKIPCLNSVVINSRPWTLFIVKSHLLSLSDDTSMCSLFMYILPCCVSCSHLVYTTLTTITLPTSLINAMITDLVYKTPNFV